MYMQMYFYLNEYCLLLYVLTVLKKMSTNTSGKRKFQGATPLILSPADIEIEGNNK